MDQMNDATKFLSNNEYKELKRAQRIANDLATLAIRRSMGLPDLPCDDDFEYKVFYCIEESD